jgi:hypothetical protein
MVIIGKVVVRIKTILLLLAVLASPVQAGDWSSKAITAYFLDTRPCTFFALSGVAQADPVLPGSPYFALAKTHPNYAELYATLLTAKASQHLVDVSTSGQLACGHADVSRVILP